ncbi:MAG: sporulation protein YtfJ [Clostridia bacterium]|nr:sporulation protein YtfJ [Clostridia bacterium]
MDNQKNTQKNKLNELVDTALDNLRGLVDANTVIGTPIVTASGTTVIPVSKVSIGIAGGGNDYSQKGETASGKASFSGGGGTGLTMIPLGFLVVSPDGSVELLNISNPTGKKGAEAAKPAPDLGSAIETVLDKAPEAISKIKDVFTKKKKDEPAPDEMEIVTDDAAGEQK